MAEYPTHYWSHGHDDDDRQEAQRIIDAWPGSLGLAPYLLDDLRERIAYQISESAAMAAYYEGAGEDD